VLNVIFFSSWVLILKGYFFFNLVVYKLDKDFNILDENDHYLIAKDGSHIKLTSEQIDKLKEHNMMSWFTIEVCFNIYQELMINFIEPYVILIIKRQEHTMNSYTNSKIKRSQNVVEPIHPSYPTKNKHRVILN
jgi:hypothetical protein